MATGNPQLYLDQGDFVIAGEAENAFLSGQIGDFSGLVQAGQVKDLDALPFPDWSHLAGSHGRYGLVKTSRGRFLPMLSSRGCPMSCSYYCTYPLVQGASFRGRSPSNVVDEAAVLQARYGMTTVMFHDPIFSLKMERVAEICELILERGLRFSWICETHPRFLTPDLIRLMRRAGCVSVKLGIESGNPQVMKLAHRALPELLRQEQIVHCLEQNQIDVLAFYILGYFDDTHPSIQQTIDYAIALNTFGAQFTIATPYPGTPWFKELNSQPEKYRLDATLEHYNQYRLVYQHPQLSPAQLEHFKSQAYQRYYLRWGYLRKNLLKRALRRNNPESEECLDPERTPPAH